MIDARFTRQVALFGVDGQERIAAASCAIVGVGGLGTHLVQQLSLLGVRRFWLIDHEELSESNRNRYVGVRYSDPVPGFRKVDLGARIAQEIDPAIEVNRVFDSFISEEGFAAIRSADYIFGALDLEGSRLVMNEVCSAYDRAYFDLASDILPGEEAEYGGRVCISLAGEGCLHCLGVLDQEEAAEDLASDGERRNKEAVYGVSRTLLGRTGPSVVSINGIVASLAVNEFMVTVTGLRKPQQVLTYRGTTGKVFASIEQTVADCYYCFALRGLGKGAGIDRYLMSSVGTRLL